MQVNEIIPLVIFDNLLITMVHGRYENTRGEAPKDATYFANAHVLLHDDTCFRFASLPRDRASFQLMDPDKSEVPAGADTCYWLLLLAVVTG